VPRHEGRGDRARRGIGAAQEDWTVKPGITTISVRCDREMLNELDKWRRAQPGALSRAAAIRRLAKQALAGTTATGQRSSGSTRQAADMAGRELDHLGDQKATGEERAQRKRRLIKGPREFRDMRRDQPKTKS
jgi:hypothetical protein